MIDAAAVGRLTDADRADAATAVNALGFAVHQQLAGGDATNVVTSPLSIELALAMLTAGTAGQTADQLIGALALTDARDERFSQLLLDLSAVEGVELGVANALWGDDQATLLDEYVAHVTRVFGATAETLDLNGPEAKATIDGWVAEHTNNRIHGIAEALGIPNPDAYVVLANAVWFLGEWTTAFDPDATFDQSFTLGDGTVVELPRMRDTREMELGTFGEHRVARLPYGTDERFGMELFLPAEDSDLSTLLAELDASGWDEAVGSLRTQEDVRLELPPFELSYDTSLVAALRALGVTDVFTDGLANLSGLSAREDLILGEVAHKTWIRVNEEGTEAAAVTGMVAVTTSMPAGPPPPTFIVDRPFAFTISDRDTGTIVFLGTVNDPRG